MDALKYITPKFFTTIRNYSKGQFIKDLIAGVIVAIIALPLSIALAIASGVNPEQGLYTAVVAGFFISFLGGSRVQIGGPTAAFVVIIYGIIAQYGMAGLTLATLMAGLMLIIMGLLRFGDLIKFIPKTITLGFTLGIAVGIVAGQVKDFLGLEMKSVPAEFLEKLLAYGKHLSSISWPTLAIGILALVIQIFWPRLSQKIPGSLVAIIVTTAIVAFGHLPVKTIGDLYTIKAGLPSFTVPDLSFSLIRQMMSPAFTIAILAAIESLLSCVVSDGMIGGNHRSNAELIGQGVGNIMSALFGGIPATGAIARTAANNFLNVINDDGKNVLILRMRNVPAMDISGLDALEETLAICQKRGMTLLLSHVNAQPYRVLEKSGFIQTIGPDNICESTDQALEKAVALAKEG